MATEPRPAAGAGVDAGERADLRARDMEARRAVQREFGRPLVLVAGAGTGKTGALVARIVAWCLGPGWEKAAAEAASAGGEAAAGAGGAVPADSGEVAARVLEGVVAITFTEAAAAEMAQRVAETLAAAERDQPPPWLDLQGLLPAAAVAPRARRLLTRLDRLHVSTIHAFCRRLLAAHPLEAGLHPAFTVDADGDALEEAVREAVEEGLARAYAAPGDPHALALAARGLGPPEVAEALRGLVEVGLPPETLEADAFSAAAVQALYGEIERSLAAFTAAGGACLEKASGRASITLAAAAVPAALRRHLEAGAAAGREGLQALSDDLRRLADGRVRRRLDSWAAADFNRTEQDCLGGREEAVAAACADLAPLVRRLCRLDPTLYEDARATLAPLARAVRVRLRQRGVATFQDLLAGARDLLAGHPRVRRLERRRIDQLLVDEFQDTDRLQCEVLRWLALEGPAEERPGLFLVGDPKQSIYGWRDADLAAYQGFVDDLLAAGGEEHHLVVNFRSVPAVLAEVERLIAPVMTPQEGVQPPFEPLLPCPERRADPGFAAEGRRAVEHWISWLPPAGEEAGGAATRTSRATELEAAALAHDLRELRDAGALDWPDAALLLRAASDLEVYLRAFQEQDIPYAVARDRSYYRRREVMEAAALVRAVLDPADHLALLTALRSAWVGVPDAALLPLWQGGLPEIATELLAPDPERLARAGRLASLVAGRLAGGAYRDIPGLTALAGWEASLTAFVRTLAELRASFAAEPAHRFVERLRTATLIEATEAARFLGAWRLANLDRFFRQLAQLLDEGGDADALVRFLRRAVAESREAQEGRPREAAEQAVQVMTVHAAKGLGFRHVYLAQLHKRTAGGWGGERRTAARETAEGWQLLLFGAPSPGWWWAEEREERVRAAEQVRLLYVAATRAGERLVLAGKPPERPKEEPGRAETFADLLPFRRGWPDDLEARLARLAESGERAEIDADGVRWVLPPPAGEAAPPSAATADVPSPDELTRDAAALARLRREAAARMARPFRGAASAESHRKLDELFAALEPEEEGALPAGGGEGAAATATVTGEGGVGAGAAAVSGEAGAPATESGADRPAAVTAGSAVHRLLEDFDLSAEDPRAELARRRRDLGRTLAGLVAGAELEAARQRAEAVLHRFTAGPLWHRFLALDGHVVARELPVLLPPEASMEAGLARPGREDQPVPSQGTVGGGGVAAGLARPNTALPSTPPPTPVGVIAGAVDLLYRDPETAELVVADYKTDEVTAAADLEARAAVYLSQGEAYRRAVQEALDLPAPPRLELWFLAAGRVWTAKGPAGDPSPRPAAPPPDEPLAARDRDADPAEPRPGEQLRLF